MGLLATAGSVSGECKTEDKPNNVLLIIVDDLRPELTCYQRSGIVSPNIDALADRGVLFKRAYCNIAVSGASRASLLTGTRPTRNTFIKSSTRADVEKPDAIAINDYFRAQGYYTMSGGGKIFHWADDHAEGWDELRERMPAYSYTDPVNLAIREMGERAYVYECMDMPDSAYSDGQIADQAIKDIERLAKEDKPFFYGLGFFKPHLPFNAPKKYFDLYDCDKIELPDNYTLKPGHGIPDIAMPGWQGLRSYGGIPQTGAVPADMARKLIRAYRACVSFTDAQIGRVIAKLKSLGLDKNTVIVLVGDHGWNLGEHGTWCKQSILHTSIHAPMIIVDPASKLKGYRSDEVVEFVDLFPTICDVAGIEKPRQLEGESLYPLLNDSEAKSGGYAVARWEQGYTIVTDDRFCYTEWWDKEDNIIERLLFDHNTDPDENYNVAHKRRYTEKVKELSLLLHERRGSLFDRY
jgi:arylsulfatase A-like enzyme